MAVIDKQNIIDQINALASNGDFNQQDVTYLINYLIANGDTTGSPRDLIQVRRGNLADLPNLAQGEIGFTLDTNEIYIGGTNGNVRILETVNAKTKVAGANPLTDLRIVFQYNYENNIDKILLVKQLGFNVVIIPKNEPFTLDNARMLACLDLLANYGLRAILENDIPALLGANYAAEQARISALESHPAVIGFMGHDEPMFHSVSKIDQETVYSRIKAVTVKNVFVCDTGPTPTRIANYYTPYSYDVYMLDFYFTGGVITPEETITGIQTFIMNLKNADVVQPKQIIPVLPLYSEAPDFHEPSESEIKAHIDAWRPFYTGSYGVFGFNNALLTSTLDTSERLRKLSTLISPYFLSHVADTTPNFQAGMKINKANADGYAISMKDFEGSFLKVNPKTDLNLDTPFIWLTNANQTENKIVLTKGGFGSFYGGLAIGGGDTVKKWMFATATLNFGTIPEHDSVSMTIPVSGVQQGDNVIATPYTTAGKKVSWNPYVSAAGVVTITVSNGTILPIDFSADWIVTIIRH